MARKSLLARRSYDGVVDITSFPDSNHPSMLDGKTARSLPTLGLRSRIILAIAAVMIVAVLGILTLYAPALYAKNHFAKGLDCHVPTVSTQKVASGTVKTGSAGGLGYEAFNTTDNHTLAVSRCRIDASLARTDYAQSTLPTSVESSINQRAQIILSKLSVHYVVIALLALAFVIAMCFIGRVARLNELHEEEQQEFKKREANQQHVSWTVAYNVAPKYWYFVSAASVGAFIMFIVFANPSSSNSGLIKWMNAPTTSIVKATSGGASGLTSYSNKVYAKTEIAPFGSSIYGLNSRAELDAARAHIDRYLSGQPSPLAEAKRYQQLYNNRVTPANVAANANSVASGNTHYASAQLVTSSLLARTTVFWRVVSLLVMILGTALLLISNIVVPKHAVAHLQRYVLALAISYGLLAISSFALSLTGGFLLSLVEHYTVTSPLTGWGGIVSALFVTVFVASPYLWVILIQSGLWAASRLVRHTMANSMHHKIQALVVPMDKLSYVLSPRNIYRLPRGIYRLITSRGRTPQLVAGSTGSLL
jgi:hypothetical protein